MEDSNRRATRTGREQRASRSVFVSSRGGWPLSDLGCVFFPSPTSSNWVSCIHLSRGGTMDMSLKSETPSKLQRDAARNIVTKYLKVRAGENAIIESWNHTMPMASTMLDEVRRVGGLGLLVCNDEDAWWRAIDRKQSKLIGKASAPEWAALKAADVYVNFWGPGDTDRMEKFPDSANDAFDWNWRWYAVARKTGLRGIRMTAGFATEGRARQWGLDRAEWEESFLRASLVDPEEMAKSGARLSKALSRGKRVRITHSNGTDVEVALAGVAPRLQDGRPHPWSKKDSPSGMVTSIPAGFVDVALDSKT